jgi:DASH complex subunit DAD3
MEQGAPSGILSPPELTPLEQEVLDEYERLADNMNKVWHSCPSVRLETDALF